MAKSWDSSTTIALLSDPKQILSMPETFSLTEIPSSRSGFEFTQGEEDNPSLWSQI
ncbi:2720_t:CDS:1, partial [Acaulospora colombiana]